ncbi:hypothetical protein [Flavobacterium selenitireducens]|uniref:hypothetical protein n=1 Tax=Flavobacterium selenitireducens TaxID=2722704 RepID=UPI00168AA1F3|nr:hypothetical protein [Flavobacterium selenitireducens]MBD3582968.1 hypothetical protein [Flavobacterium selenitireducens]
MKRLSVKNITFFSSTYFALSGLVFLTMVYSSQRSAILVGLVLFGATILPVALPFSVFRLIYGIFAFMASLVLTTAFIFQGFSWGKDQLLSSMIILLVLSGYLLASVGLVYSSVRSLDAQRFTLI